MTEAGIEYKTIEPKAQLSSFVESFWMVVNHSDSEHEIVLLPDGRFDILFSVAAADPFHATLKGLDTKPEQAVIPPKAVMFAVSFKLLAIEYLLQNKVAAFLNEGVALPNNFWDITVEDLNDFETFCEKISAKLSSLVKPDIDSRKQLLFELIYSSGGSLPVKEMSERVYWSSRQINRYFNERFGLSLKAYCRILRFKGSLPQIKNGKLFPEQYYSDQSHFVKEVKRFSGVVPKELFVNKNDRFILLSALSNK